MMSNKFVPYVIGVLLLAAEAVLIFLDWGPWDSAASPALYFWMEVAGGPLCLVAALSIAFYWTRHAGALLWLGAATLALGIALRSGIQLRPYFLGLLCFVVPQVLVATLFLLQGRAANGPIRRR